MARGLIKWFSSSAGIGMIEPFEGEKKIPLKVGLDLAARLTEGMEVEFDFFEGSREDKAVNIKIVE